jgi:DNA end-binding protein Ku
MPRAVWTGWIGFGLVLIPVKLHPATTPRDVRFNEFVRGSGKRIRHRRVVDEEVDQETTWDLSPPSPPDLGEAMPAARPAAQEEGEEREAREGDHAVSSSRQVEYEDVVKGFEIEPGRYVMLEREELDALRPTPDRTIHIEAFVPLEQIDPVYFERSYYLSPGRGAEDPVGGERSYALLLAALDEAGRVGIGRFVMRTKEYLAAVRPMDGILGLETLFFDDEVRQTSEVLRYGVPSSSERELKVAMALIDVMAADWEPSAYPDTYRERVMELIQQRAEGLEPVIEEEARARPEMADLLAALRQSVEEAKGRQGSGKPSRRGRRASG